MRKGRLFLIPVDLAPETTSGWVGGQLRDVALRLRQFVVEHPKSARRFLKALGLPLPELALEIFDEHSKPDAARKLAQKLEAGVDLGLLSEAGCPAIADPGALLVAEAHRIGAQVIPLVGPSSIVMALMASGLNGQRFTFNGYLPRRAPQLEQCIRELEQRSQRLNQTEIFIEAPYRNEQLFAALLATCRTDTRLCIAADLTADTEQVMTRTIGEWAKGASPQLDRRPTVFLLLAQPASAQRRTRSRGPQ